MKKNILKKIVVFILLITLSSCGSNNNDNNNENHNKPSTNFTPKTADDFEDKFANKTITPPSGNKITILSNKKIKQSINNVIGESSYTFTFIKDTIILKYTINNITCDVSLTWTSALGGNAKEEYSWKDGNQKANGTFSISENN